MDNDAQWVLLMAKTIKNPSAMSMPGISLTPKWQRVKYEKRRQCLSVEVPKASQLSKRSIKRWRVVNWCTVHHSVFVALSKNDVPLYLVRFPIHNGYELGRLVLRFMDTPMFLIMVYMAKDTILSLDGNDDGYRDGELIINKLLPSNAMILTKYHHENNHGNIMMIIIVMVIPIIYYPKAPCMVYLPTFTYKIPQLCS